MAQERKLGKGLDFLISGGQATEQQISENTKRTEIREIDTALIKPNRYQPRFDFGDEESIKSLSESIKSEGVLQPIIVRREGDGYEIVTGERRWRASKMLKLAKVPAIIMDVDDKRLLTLALIENLQRKDLNPFEKATAFKALIEKFGLTQEMVASALGVDQASVSNYLRILNLQPEVQQAVTEGKVTLSHALLLLSITNNALQVELCRKVVKEGLSTKKLEQAINILSKGKTKKISATRTPNIIDLEERIQHTLGTKVYILAEKKGGRIVIEYYDTPSFNAILQRLGVQP